MSNSTPLFNDFCPSCGSLNTIEALEPPNSVHFGRLNCNDCKRFIRWLPKPKIFQVCITKLLQNSTLQPWERQFLKTVVLRTPTPAEEIVIGAIEGRVKTLHTHQT